MGLCHIKAHNSVYGGCPVLMSGDTGVNGFIVFPVAVDRVVHIAAVDAEGNPVEVDSQRLHAGPQVHWVAVGVKTL
jgi:hypothetical protein